ncbi:MAG TPA: methyltransferase domain-containing protein [Gemmatimonadaceae bacterium]|nr:methyltransferase domain-containing protein [Gemmatimonadaceae bacterium]
MLAELDRVLAKMQTPRASLLDVGTGIGDIPCRARTLAARRGITLETMGVDASEVLAREARSDALPTVRADALHLPFADRSIDIVMCSQVLHHFVDRSCALAMLREMHRVALRAVIVSDLRRSWVAAAGIWLASFPLRFHPASRHDGVVSVLRGFTGHELGELVHAAVGCEPAIRGHLGFRTTAVWTPSCTAGA